MKTFTAHSSSVADPIIFLSGGKKIFNDIFTEEKYYKLLQRYNLITKNPKNSKSDMFYITLCVQCYWSSKN